MITGDLGWSADGPVDQLANFQRLRTDEPRDDRTDVVATDEGAQRCLDVCPARQGRVVLATPVTRDA